MRECRVLLGAGVLLGCGCQINRALKEPIPASAALRIQDERTERIGQVICATLRRERIAGISWR